MSVRSLLGLINNKVKNHSPKYLPLEAYDARYLWLATLAEIWFRLYIEGLGYEGRSELNRLLSS